jgi:hypothetical protein
MNSWAMEAIGMSRATRVTPSIARLLATVFLSAVVARLVVVWLLGWPRRQEGIAGLASDAVAALLLVVVAWLPSRVLRVMIAWTVGGFLAIGVLAVASVGVPLSLPMLAGADPAMGDSIRSALSRSGVLGAAAVLLTTAIALHSPIRAQLRHVSVRWGVIVGLMLIAGPGLCVGMPERVAHRNAVLHFLSGLRTPQTVDSAPLANVLAGSAAPPGLSAMRAACRDMNVLVVVLESAPALELRPYGATDDPMPFLTGLTADSLVCTDAYAVYPESIKGQIAIFHGVHPAPRTDASDYACIPIDGVATQFAKSGYSTALFHSGRFRFLGMESVLTRSGFAERFDAESLPARSESSFGVDEESTVDALLQWVDSLDERRFFAAWLPIAGHHPYSAPDRGPFVVDGPHGAWQNAVHYADRCLRRLWDGVRSRGLADNTVLVVVGDHGQAFGQHGGNFGHTFEVFEENVRVPWLMRVPGMPVGGTRIETPVSHVDLAPTLLDLCGLPMDDRMEGVSLLREQGRPVLFFADWGSLLLGVRVGAHKLIVDVESGGTQLYDLATDPLELTNLAAREPERVANLRALAEQRWLPRTAWVRGW